MKTTIVPYNHQRCVVVKSDQVLIKDGQSALDTIMSLQYETGLNRMAFYKEAIDEAFFDLKTGIAGEVLQKMINYHIQFAIIGDFSTYTSKALRDFIYESNKGKEVFFVKTQEEALAKLTQE